MKLIRCHIENYGTLTNFDYDFNDNLNVILKENGWGKTTFGSFIKAMLFGLEKTTKQNLDENERKKYTPWQGGKFGGWLEFQLQNNNYRIERFFGKTQNQDTVKIFDLHTNNEIADTDFVEHKLGINEKTFMRSTYIQHNFEAPKDDETLKEKFGKLIENQNIESVGEITKKLTAKQTNLKLQRGKGGLIYLNEQKLNEVLYEIENCLNSRTKEKQLNEEYNENLLKLKNIQQQISAFRQQIQAINDNKNKDLILKQYTEKKQEIEKLNLEKNEILEFFNNEPPTQTLLNNLQENQQLLDNYKSNLEELNKNNNAEKFEELSTYFKAGIPDESELNSAQENIKNLENLKLKKQLPKNQIISKKPTQFKTKNIISLVCGVFALIFVLLGAILFHNTLPIMLTLIAIGLIFAGIGVFLLLKPVKIDNIPANNELSLNNDILDNEIKLYENKLIEFVQKYNENIENFQNALINISLNKKQYFEYKNNQELIDTRKQTYIQNIQEIEEKLNKFYKQFYPNFTNYNQCLNDCRIKIENLKILEKNINEKQLSLQKFYNENNINEIKNTTINITDLESIKEQILTLENQQEDVNKNNNLINSQLINLSNITNNLGSLLAEKEELEETISNLNAEHNTVKNTIKYLEIAKNNLTAKYLNPLAEEFKKYSNKLVGNKFDKISIDTQLNILIEQFGEKKETKYYSSGGRDVLELCMRLALAKTLFEDEIPPIIMDDPFNNFDDTKTKNGLNMLEEISKEFQVIYLVCHSSRVKK